MEPQKRHLFLPAEWHRQEMVQLTWPHENTDWNYMLDEVEACFIELAKAISAREKLLIVAPDTDKVYNKLKDNKASIGNITMFKCETNDTWARDHGFITLLGDNVPHYADFCFNGWGCKFEASLDNAINGKLYDAGVVKGEYEDCTSFVLEGGSIESDGKGTLLTTSQCLMAPHRNQPMTQEEVEATDFTASVGGGVVEATVTGAKVVKDIKISPDAVDPEEIEMLQDLVIAAVNEALRKAEDAMMQGMEKAKGGLLRGVTFVDEYKGKQIPTGKKSVTIRLVIGSGEKTLTGDEIEQVANSVLKRLAKTIGAEIRTN